MHKKGANLSLLSIKGSKAYQQHSFNTSIAKNDQVYHFISWAWCLHSIYKRYSNFLGIFSHGRIWTGLTQEEAVLVEKFAFEKCDYNKDSKLCWTEVDYCEVSKNIIEGKRMISALRISHFWLRNIKNYTDYKRWKDEIYHFTTFAIFEISRKRGDTYSKQTTSPFPPRKISILRLEKMVF